MNERIREIVKQSATDTSGKWISLENAEKLVESIVRECARVSATKAGTFDKDSFVAQRIKEHFGVEE